MSEDEDQTEPSPMPSLPKIRRPSPIALRRLDRFLQANKLRLVDIFTLIDKDKTWTVNQDQFKAAVNEVCNTAPAPSDSE